MTEGGGADPSGSARKDMHRRTSRGMAWIGVASSMVGLLDILALVILLAMGMSKDQYGTALLATSLFPVLDLITDLGLTSAVIQRDDHTQERISTIFWLNVLLSLALAAIVALGVGPILAWVHGDAIIAWLLAAYGGKLLWQNVYFIPYALMKRELRFKELSILRVIANLAEFAGKVGFFAAGFGIWCLVLGPLCRVFVTGVGTQILHPWRPRMVLRFRDALDWASYGIKTSASKILFYLYTNADYQIVARVFGKEANGLYGAAYQLVLQPAHVISEIVTNVAFPAFSRLKHDRQGLIDQLLAFTRMNMVVMLMFVGVVLVSTVEIFELLSYVQDEDWTPAAPAARILCAVAVLRALSYVLPPLLDGINRPTLTLRYTVIASIVMPLLFVLCALLLGDALGYVAVALAWAIGYPIAFAALIYMTTSVLEISPAELAKRIIGIPLCAAAATILSFGASIAVQPLPAPLRLAINAFVMVVSFSVFLARFQGISPRSVTRSLRG